MPPTPPYSPADVSLTLPALDFLHSRAGQSLLSQLATSLQSHPTLTVADIATLRKSHPPDIVHAALTLAQLQKKARLKFPDLPFTWAVPEALEQATDARVAAHKANRFANAGATKILDLCAGIGGDTVALAKIAPTTAYDLSPIRTTCLRYNLDSLHLSAEIRTEDIRTLLAFPQIENQKSKIENPQAFFHIDPARRSAGKRSPAFEDLIPGPDLLLPLMARFPAGALKLSPAVDFDSLPPGHLEIISHNRTVVQAVLWTGKLAEPFPAGSRTATIIEDNAPSFSHTAPPESPTLTPTVASYLFEADPALTRAAIATPLAKSLDLHALTIDAGYLTGDTPPPPRRTRPLPRNPHHPLLPGTRHRRAQPSLPHRPRPHRSKNPRRHPRHQHRSTPAHLVRRHPLPPNRPHLSPHRRHRRNHR